MNINLYAPIGGTGYGNASWNILKELSKENDICLVPIGTPWPESQEQANLIRGAISKQVNFDAKSPCLKIWHQFDLLSRLGTGQYSAFPFFEIDKFNELEKHNLSCVDKIFASSQWAKEVIENNGIKKPTEIVNLGVDTSIFHPIDVPKRTKNFTFITIGKWEIRKSHDVIIECFNKAFNSNDDVELWMVTNNPFLDDKEEKEWLYMVETSNLKSKIKVFPRLRTQAELAQVMSYASCGIYPSRAEGWNLELLETMAMNKPVIATNYSAHTEYCNPNNSYLIDVLSTEKAQDNKWFHGTGNWAKIDESVKDQIIDHMKFIYKNNINTNEAGIETAKKYSWENTAKQIIRCIE